MQMKRNTRVSTSIVAVVVGAGAGAGGLASGARAADYFVGSGDTAGLIAAIQAANANPGADTIHLAGSDYTFAQGDFNGNALPIVTDELTIEGNEATIARVSASSFRIITNNAQLTLHDATIAGGSASTGAGIINNGQLILNGCVLSENRGGGNGGAIFNQVGARVEAIDTRFERNAANGHSGGAISSGGEVVVSGCTFIANESTSGGAIDSAGSVVVSGCAFTDNFTTTGLGGAINNFNNGTLEISSSSFTGNQAGSSGGAISQRGIFTTLEGCTFIDNAALTRDGGALHVELGSASAEHCVFTGNAAQDHGGGINAGVPVSMTACLISDNSAGLDGGGMRGYNSGGFDLNGVTVAGNTAGREGGGVYAFSAATVILNSTISGNTAATEGGGLRMWNGAAAVITNATFHANAAGLPSGVGGGGLRVQFNGPDLSNSIISGSTGGDVVGPVADLGYNLVEDGSGLTHATSVAGDPKLAPLADNGGPTPTHHLIFGSPAIHAGDCAGGTLEVDQRGVSRPQAFGCDIGAYEAPPCPPDLNGDVRLDFFDLQRFLQWFADGDVRADWNEDEALNFFDVQTFVASFAAGCE